MSEMPTWVRVVYGVGIAIGVLLGAFLAYSIYQYECLPTYKVIAIEFHQPAFLAPAGHYAIYEGKRRNDGSPCVCSALISLERYYELKRQGYGD